MDKVFVVCHASRIYQDDVDKVNTYLAERANRFVSNIVPITQCGDGNKYYGCIITVSER